MEHCHIQSCSARTLLTTVDLTTTTNTRMFSLKVPITTTPNGLIFGWNLALYQNRYHYSTLDNSLEDWEDHWLQAFCPLYDLQNVSTHVYLTALMEDTNWKFNACSCYDGIFRIPFKQ